MPPITQVLNRRSDLSTFLVHLTKQTPDGTASQNLKNMLHFGRIYPTRAQGWGKRLTLGAAYVSQKAVCFTEAPLDQIHGLLDIEDRQVNLEPYGLVFTKMVARRKGANPVWYVDTAVAHPQNLEAALDELVMQAKAGPEPFETSAISKVLPFFEEMGISATGHKKEFWWEREWRCLGDFEFGATEIALILAPEEEHAAFGTYGPHCVDAAWSLERMIAALAGLSESDVTPFTA